MVNTACIHASSQDVQKGMYCDEVMMNSEEIKPVSLELRLSENIGRLVGRLVSQ